MKKTTMFKLVASFISAIFLSFYLNFDLIPLVTVVFMVCIFEGMEYLTQKRFLASIDYSILTLSIIGATVVILGKHLHIKSPYDGLMYENYITPYSVQDILALLFLSFGLYVLLSCLYCFSFKVHILDDDNIISKKHQSTYFLPILIFLFAAWTPYLLCYWPAFFFADTENSLLQAVGKVGLNNRNPLLYTFFIKFCTLLGGSFRSGDLTISFAIYSVLQMIYIASCLSYMISWIAMVCRVRKEWIYILTAIYAFSPYIAASSIAMWKDPVFCASVVAYSITLLEFAISKGEKGKNKRWLVKYILLSLIILFWRNNGFCAVLASIVFLFIFLMRDKIQKKSSHLPTKMIRRILCISLILVVLWAIVIVPGYKIFGIGTPKEETAGLMLNQMARVAAYNGNMSDKDKAYLDTLIPLELYHEIYRPCCVDMLKWDGNFNYSALAGSEFLETWVSLLLKNPRLYFEAWELQTFGFWTVNQPIINKNTLNISFGSPYNFRQEKNITVGGYSLTFKNLLGNDSLHDMFPADSWSIPIGALNWLIVFICLCLIKKNQWHLTIALAPQLGIAIGLIAGTPIYYLPRYEASAQFLLPIYLLLLFSNPKSVTD